MSNVISTAIFCAKNTKKADNGDYGRAAVAVAQANNIFQAVTAYDNSVGKTAKVAVDALSRMSEKEKLLDYAGKGVSFLSKNVNPLICISSGVQIMSSDDKEKTAIVQASALGAMFIGEGTMKKEFPKIREYKGMNKVIEHIMKFAKKIKCEKGMPAIVKGVAFVTGSTLSYAAGEKLGKMAVKSVRDENIFAQGPDEIKEQIMEKRQKQKDS